jgi:hypothetical protein
VDPRQRSIRPGEQAVAGIRAISDSARLNQLTDAGNAIRRLAMRGRDFWGGVADLHLP